jgi:hypothetical protein
MNSGLTPNFYKFSDDNHNRKIFKDLAPDLYENQRVMITLRPAIVKSGMSEIILNLFRINKFTILKVGINDYDII